MRSGSPGRSVRSVLVVVPVNGSLGAHRHVGQDFLAAGGDVRRLQVVIHSEERLEDGRDLVLVGVTIQDDGEGDSRSVVDVLDTDHTFDALGCLVEETDVSLAGRHLREGVLLDPRVAALVGLLLRVEEREGAECALPC